MVFYNKIYCGSALNMKEIPNESVDLIVTSPPYNVGIEYDNYTDDLPFDDYLFFLMKTWKECWRVLKSGGRICINICNVHRQPYVHYSGLIAQQLVQIGYTLRGEVIWDKGGSARASTAWGSWQSPSNPTLRDGHEYIIIAHKLESKLQHNGKTDMSKRDFTTYTLGEWYFRPKSTNKKHPVPFPLELPLRCIKLYSFIGDVVLDPFMGSGTTAFAAKMLKRNYIGYDISEKYCKLSREKVRAQFLHDFIDRNQ